MYQIAKYLAKTLALLTKSGFCINSTKHFISEHKGIKIEPGYKIASFDVVSLFTSVPLNDATDIIFRKVYDDKLINIKVNDLQLLLELRTKEMNVSFNRVIYRQVNRVAMCCSLGSSFMVEFGKHSYSHVERK